jgi:hypothetical protein
LTVPIPISFINDPEHQPKLVSFGGTKSSLKEKQLLKSSGGSNYSDDEEPFDEPTFEDPGIY